MTLKLPRVTDPTTARVHQALEAEDIRNRKHGADLDLQGERLIIQSPNGTRYQILVSDTGLVVAAPAVVSGNALPSLAVGTGLFTLTGGTILTLPFPAASKSNQQTGTSATTVVTPLHQQDHDSAAKAWVEFDNTGAILASYNVTSVTKNGTGDFTINFTTAFASGSYAVIGIARGSAASNGWCQANRATAQAASSVRIGFITPALTLFDPDAGHVVCFGRQ